MFVFALALGFVVALFIFVEEETGGREAGADINQAACDARQSNQNVFRSYLNDHHISISIDAPCTVPSHPTLRQAWYIQRPDSVSHNTSKKNSEPAAHNTLRFSEDGEGG